MYPNFLQPTTTEPFIVNGKETDIPKCIVTFEQWHGDPVKETFGGKPIVVFNNKPMFAEMAIMQNFISDGWQARWIETYGKSKTSPIHLSDWKDDKYKTQIHDPIVDKEILKLLEVVAKQNGNNYHGCWDVLAWKEDRFIFAESKRTKKDNIRTSQTNWLTAGINAGLNINNFLIVQWDM